MARLNTSLTHNGGYSLTYTYEVENLTDEDWEFSFPDIRNSTYAIGWSGAVPANDSTSITNTVGGSGETVCTQSTQATLWPAADSNAVLGRPMKVYIPQGRAAFTGDTTIQSATYSSSVDANIVVFRVSAPAMEAYLYREHAGSLSLVGSRLSAMAAATDYEFVDPDPPSGDNVYYVVAGVRTNPSISEKEEVEN